MSEPQLTADLASEASAEPSTNNGHETDRPVCRCGAGPHRRDPELCARGHVLAGNAKALTHGAGRRQPIVNPEATELFASWARDLGGRDELTAPERLLLQRGVEADAIAAGAIRYLRRSHQSLTNPRMLAAIDVWSSATAQLRGIATALGLKRRQRHVDTFEAAIAAEPEAR